MATTADTFRGKSRAPRGWVFPVLALVAGTVVTLGVAALLSVTKARMPVLAAVDEVHLVAPASGQAKEETREWAGLVRTDWSVDYKDHPSRLRGNVLTPRGESISEAIPAAVPKANPKAIPKANPESVEPKAESDETTPDTVNESEGEMSAMAADANVRWFNARPARPARTVWMTVTGYSPDERSCGDSADGLTATLHSVTTNAMRLVAADPTVLPYGSMVSVPGYDAESIVPVLDCGGAIKGDKLDLLFPTHEEALQWGRQRILVTVWEYTDGLPAENPRKVR